MESARSLPTTQQRIWSINCYFKFQTERNKLCLGIQNNPMSLKITENLLKLVPAWQQLTFTLATLTCWPSAFPTATWPCSTCRRTRESRPTSQQPRTANTRTSCGRSLRLLKSLIFKNRNLWNNLLWIECFMNKSWFN